MFGIVYSRLLITLHLQLLCVVIDLIWHWLSCQWLHANCKRHMPCCPAFCIRHASSVSLCLYISKLNVCMCVLPYVLCVCTWCRCVTPSGAGPSMQYNGRCKLHLNQAKRGNRRGFWNQLCDTTPFYVTNNTITNNKLLSFKSLLSPPP